MARRRLGADARALTKKGKPCDGAVRGKKNSRRRAGGGEGISDFGNVLLTKNLGSESDYVGMVVGGKRRAGKHGNIYLDGR